MSIPTLRAIPASTVIGIGCVASGKRHNQQQRQRAGYPETAGCCARLDIHYCSHRGTRTGQATTADARQPILPMP